MNWSAAHNTLKWEKPFKFFNTLIVFYTRDEIKTRILEEYWFLSHYLFATPIVSTISDK